MPFVTYAERIGRKQGLTEGIEIGREQGVEIGKRAGVLTAIELALQIDHKEYLLPDVAAIQDLDRLQDVYVHLISGAPDAELRALCEPAS